MLRQLIILMMMFSVAGCSVPNKGVKVYFYNADKIVAVEREFPTNENPALIAIDMLMKGPSEQEIAAGIMTEIPAGTRSRSVNVEGETAIINFNSTLGEYQGDSAGAQRLVSQIIYTATSVKGIKKVLIKMAGHDQFTLGKDEYLIDHPLERGDVKN